jgi:pyruvate, water dikinase
LSAGLKASVPRMYGVGGKNASLGEMIGALKKEGIGVPDGFATTAEAYWKFLEANDLRERLKSQLDDLNSRNKPLHEVGRAIRSLFLHAEFPEDIARDIREAYRELCRRSGTGEVDVAVRSSATAEDLPEASFSGPGGDDVLRRRRSGLHLRRHPAF